MKHTSTAPSAVETLEVPDARLYYEVRGAGPRYGAGRRPDGRRRPSRRWPTCSPADHTVLTTRPAGHQPQPRRRPRPGLDPGDARRRPLSGSWPTLTAGPAAVLGSSGGAVSALALAQTHPELVHTVVAHEPPLNELLDDREQLHAQTEDIIATYLSGDVVGCLGKFLATGQHPHCPKSVFEEMFGGNAGCAGGRRRALPVRAHAPPDHPLAARPRPPCARSTPHRGRHRRASRPASSATARPERSAAALGIEPTMFPGDHIGFAEDPEAFAIRLRAVLR